VGAGVDRGKEFTAPVTCASFNHSLIPAELCVSQWV